MNSRLKKPNPVARNVRTPKFRQRIIPDKREKIKSKEWGGDKRQVTIENVVINGQTASAQVTFKGEKMTFVSLMNLVQTADNHWLLISDMPIIKA